MDKTGHEAITAALNNERITVTPPPPGLNVPFVDILIPVSSRSDPSGVLIALYNAKLLLREGQQPNPDAPGPQLRFLAPLAGLVWVNDSNQVRRLPHTLMFEDLAAPPQNPNPGV